MRIAASMLTLPAALACAWFGAAAAWSSLLLALLALLNGVGALLLRGRPRPAGLWAVLLAGVISLACAVWQHLPPAEATAAAGQTRAIVRWLLVWAALLFSLAGWAGWWVARFVHPREGRGDL